MNCRRCGSEMVPGQALAQTFVGGMPDFIGDRHAITFSAGGPGKVIECIKCPDCGHSITRGPTSPD